MTKLILHGEKRNENIGNLIKFLEYMNDIKNIKSELGTMLRNHQGNIDRLKSIAKTIIENEIYNSYQPARPERRTGSTLESITVWKSDNEDYPLSVVSDPFKSPSITGNDAGSYSYVGFFEDPTFGKGSFISPRDDPTAPSRYRPFIQLWNKELSEEFTNIVHKETNSIIKKRMPRKVL